MRSMSAVQGSISEGLVKAGEHVEQVEGRLGCDI